MMEDMMLIYRLERSIERRVFKIFVGNIDDADFETVQVGIVKEDGADTLFLMFLDQIDNNGNHLIAAQELSESAALTKLETDDTA
jgi:ABC-2 type transport system permease protein